MIKTYNILLLFVFSTTIAFSQGLRNEGANIVLNSNVDVVLGENANLVNNGTVIRGNSTVHFRGTTNQTIEGTSVTSFNNLTINNTGGDVRLGNNINTFGTLLMSSGDFDMKSYVIDLGTTGLLSNEASARRLKATDGSGNDGKGTGYISATRTNPSGNVAGLGLNLSGPALGNSVIIRGHERQQGSGSFTSNYSIFRYYEVQAGSYSDFDFVFEYFPLHELNSHLDGTLIAFQKVQYVHNGSPGPVYWEPLATTNTSPTATASSVTSVLQANVRITLASDSKPLPVELLSFSGECFNNNVVLSWSTASEQNNDYFEIQKSYNANDFSIIATVPGSGTSNEHTDYSYTDYNNNGDKTFYRIIQYDYDGNSTLLNTISTSCNMSSETDLLIYYPQDQNKIYISLPAKDIEYDMLLVDQLGRKLKQKRISAKSTNEKIIIETTDLGFGVYNLILQSNDNVYTKQIVKHR